jgi:prefoldin subunit 5
MEDIAAFVSNVKEIIDKIIKMVAKSIKAINKSIGNLEKTINDINNKINNGFAVADEWISAQIEAGMDVINKSLAFLKQKIKDMMDGITKGYDRTMNNIKKSFVKSSAAKIGVKMDNETAKFTAESIPNPPMDSMLPTFDLNLEIPIPDFAMFGTFDNVTLPRLPEIKEL